MHPRKDLRRSRRRVRAFTLIEVLVTVVIASLVITAAYSVVVSTVDAKIYVEQRTKASRAGPAILGVLAEDLRGAVPPLTGREIFIGGPGDPNDNNGGILRLTTSAEPAFVQTKAKNTLIEVVYYLKRNRADQPSGLFSLYRGERTLQGEGGKFRLIYDRIKSLSIRYRPPVGEPMMHWTMSLQTLPIAVELQIEIESEAKERKEQEKLLYVPTKSEQPSYKFGTIVLLPTGGTVSEEMVIGTDEAKATAPSAGVPNAGGVTTRTGASYGGGRATNEYMFLALNIRRAFGMARAAAMEAGRTDVPNPETMPLGALEERARGAFGSNWRHAYENYIPK